MTGRVLVLGEDTRSFLSVVRSLGRSGLAVDAGWCALNAPSLGSRYIRRVQPLPPYRADDSRWLAGLVELLEREQYDLVIPVHDSSILPLQCHRSDIERAGRVYLLPDDVFRICFSKRETHELAGRLGIAVPRQALVHTPVEAAALAGAWGWPLVLKPLASVSLDNPGARHYVRKLRAAAELEGQWAELDAARGVLVEENFLGKGVGVEVLCREGAALAAFQHERVHEPLLGGGSSYRKSVPLEAGLLEATERLMRALRYTGVAMVEFKRNAGTGRWVLLEINARFWGSLPLSLAAGMDFPRYLYEMMCLGRTEFPSRYRCGLYARNWLIDLFWLRANLKADRTDPALMTVPPRAIARELLHVVALRERSDTFVLDDPGPALAELGQFARQWLEARLRGVPAVRRRMQRAALDGIARARRVLFVCKGNVCRSPFAERWLARSGRFEIGSAGFYPLAGRQPPDTAVEAAGRLGVDLRAHRSQVLEREMAAEADVILIFDREQREGFSARFPEYLDKVHWLGALDAGGALEIPDPYGSAVEGFVEVYGRVQRLLERL